MKVITEREMFFQLNKDYKEILVLKEMLEKECLPFETYRYFDGWQICYPNKDDCECSVIEHRGSYGHEEDKLEIMGLLTEEEEDIDDVVGWLTAEEVFKRIKSDFRLVIGESK